MLPFGFGYPYFCFVFGKTSDQLFKQSLHQSVDTSKCTTEGSIRYCAEFGFLVSVMSVVCEGWWAKGAATASIVFEEFEGPAKETGQRLFVLLRLYHLPACANVYEKYGKDRV